MEKLQQINEGVSNVYKWRPMELQTQKKLNVHSRLQKNIDMQPFRGRSHESQKVTSTLSTIPRWYKKFQTEGGHFRRGKRCLRQITDEKKSRISSIFNENPTLSGET